MTNPRTMRDKDITAKMDKDIIVEIPTPYGLVEIRIKAKDQEMKDDIVEWIFKGCGITTERDKQRFSDKCKKIRQLIKEAKRRNNETKGYNS